MKRWNMKACICLVLLLLLLLFCVFLRQNIFSYSNLTDAASRDYVRTLLTEADIPPENADALLRHIEEFYQVPYPNIVETGFKRACIPLFSYKDTDAFAHYDQQPDYTLICRMAAFLLLRDSITFPDTLPASLTEKDPLSRRYLTDETELLRYDLLFSNLFDRNIHSSADLAADLADYWQTAGIVFPTDTACRLLTAYGSTGNTIQNFHTAVVIYQDGAVWLLEKYDPLYPYQLSRFANEAQLLRYMKRRVQDVKYAAIFLGDTCLWTK